MKKLKTIATAKFQILSSTYFGDESRFKLTSAIDRFGEPIFFVDDAERIDPVTNLPAIIRQERTREAALAGLSWATEDTCPWCGEDGAMKMTADDYQPDARMIHGVLSCGKCGGFDDSAMAEMA